ncbi:MAG: hypothetical protein F9K24_07000 [Leptonema illini]|uniref:Uncharacterized protein n=1 Tax=Leptonema illini TaxID=183 RepID=A0A833H2W8_9LEPT|nr:MAG: hypothetical protein F9K24_07000 [Leptonema illini]
MRQQKHNTGDTHDLPLLYQEKMYALKDILETSRLVELAGHAAILGYIVSTILGYMTYISLIADINNAHPENRISTFTQYPWKPFVVYFRHARLFPDDKVLRKGFIILGLIQITSVTGFFTALRYGFHL